MKMPRKLISLLFIIMALSYSAAQASPGGDLDANKCHTDPESGLYHCH